MASTLCISSVNTFIKELNHRDGQITVGKKNIYKKNKCILFSMPAQSYQEKVITSFVYFRCSTPVNPRPSNAPKVIHSPPHSAIAEQASSGNKAHDLCHVLLFST